MFFKRKASHHNTSLIIDVRNAYIRFSVLKKTKDSTSILLSKIYKLQSDKNLLNKDNLNKLLDESLSDFIQISLPKIASKKKSKIKEIMVVFSSPWYEAKMTHVKFKSEKPVIFNKDTYESLVNKDPLLKESKENLLEKEITHVLLNDYELQDPIGKPANSVDMAFYVSHIDKDTDKNVREIIYKHFPKMPVEMHSSCFINFHTIRELFINLSNFIFIDMSASITEIGIVTNNVLESLVTIPLGKQNLLETISKECKIDETQLASSLNILANGDMDDSCSMDIHSIIQKESKRWAKEFGKVVEQLGETESMPNKAFLLTDPDIKPFLKMLLKSASIQKEIFDNSSLDIISIGKNNIAQEINNETVDNGSISDPLLLIKALFKSRVEK